MFNAMYAVKETNTMTNETTMDVYVKGEKVFSYVRETGAFDISDVEVRVNGEDIIEAAQDRGFENASKQYDYGDD